MLAALQKVIATVEVGNLAAGFAQNDGAAQRPMRRGRRSRSVEATRATKARSSAAWPNGARRDLAHHLRQFAQELFVTGLHERIPVAMSACPVRGARRPATGGR